MSSYYIVDSSVKEIPSLQELCLRIVHRELPRDLEFSLQNIEPPEVVFNMLRALNPIQLRTILDYNEREGVDVDYSVVDDLWIRHCKGLDKSIDPARRRDLFQEHAVRSWQQLYFRLKKLQQEKLQSVGEKLKRKRQETEAIKMAKRTVQINTIEPLGSSRGKRRRRSGSTVSSSRGTLRGASTVQASGGSSLMQRLKSKVVSNAPTQSVGRVSAPVQKQPAREAPARGVRSGTSRLLVKPPMRQRIAKVERREILPERSAAATAASRAESGGGAGAPPVVKETRVIRMPVHTGYSMQRIDFTRQKPRDDASEEEALFGTRQRALSEREIFGEKYADRSSVAAELRKRTEREMQARSRSERAARADYLRHQESARRRGGGSERGVVHSSSGRDGQPRKRPMSNGSDARSTPSTSSSRILIGSGGSGLGIRIPKKNDETQGSR